MNNMILSNKDLKKLNYNIFNRNLFLKNNKYIHYLSTKKKSILYVDSLLNKSTIFNENKGKRGIYR